MMTLLLLLLLLLLLSSHPHICTGAPAPNFLFIMSDDVGWGDHSYNCNNSTCPIAPPDGSASIARDGKGCPQCKFCCAPTPHLDAMAHGPNSLVFHRAYAGSACCSPTRAAVLTGRAPQRSCIDSADGSGQTPAWAKRSQRQLPWGQYTLGSAAKAAGMETFFMGKWHLGDFWPFDPEDALPPGQPGFSHPGTAGFDTWYATKASASSSMLNCNCYPGATDCAAGGGVLGPSKLLCTNYWTVTDPNASIYTTKVCNNTGKEPGDDSQFIVDHFEAWLHEADRVAKPWLALLWLHTVHVPHPAMPKWYNSVPYPSQNGDYQGTIAQMDDQIGRLRMLLRDLGLANDTVVFYTSDNGPHKQTIDTGVSVGGFLPNGEYFNGLRQCKGSIFEGGVRVPGILEWPSAIHSHRETWLPMGVYDYLPTMLDILGLKRPAKFQSWALDGISLLPWIRNAEADIPASRGKAIGLIQHDGAGAGTSQARIEEEMKLVFNPGTGECSWIDSNYSDSSAAGQWYLFNLTADPRESHDLKSQLPQLFSQLKTAHQAWVQSVTLSRSTETLCEPTGPTPPGPPGPPAPPAPPAPPVPGAFVLAMQADPSLCLTVRGGSGKHMLQVIVLAACVAGSQAQAWVLKPAGEGDQAIAAAYADTGEAGGPVGKKSDGIFLKVAEKNYPSGHACDVGNVLTLGGATGGKVNTYFIWGSPGREDGLLAVAAARGPPVGVGSAHCVGCSAMCVGRSTVNGTQLTGCGSSSTRLVAQAFTTKERCTTTLQASCGAARRSSAGDCFVCCGSHQAQLQAASCAESDLDSFCNSGVHGDTLVHVTELPQHN